jgi:Conserved TM helix
MKSTLQIAQDALYNFFIQVSNFIPKLIGSLIILIIGYFIARSLRWTAQKGLKFLKVDTLFDRSGVNGLLAKTGFDISATKLISDMIYWIIMLAIWVAFFNSMGLEVISNLINQVILFIPNLIVASLIIAVGLYLGDFVKKIVVATTTSTGQVENADTFGNIAKAGVVFLTASIALSQVGIGAQVITSVVQSVFGGLAIAFGIAFGFGGKDWAASIVNRYLGKK